MDFLPTTSSLFWKTVRLETFKDWPYQSSEDTCSPERMASAGFFSKATKEEPDLVECFICSKQLDGWEPTDDPWKEHENHQPSCAFVKLQKQDECLWTVYELFELIKAYNLKECECELENAKTKVKNEAAKLAEEIPLLFKSIRKGKRGGSKVDGD
ncbi:baculoviral IAP repeat-containing protein 5 [Vespa crabro]|uniref:baculoviral IAP repeat-containing protein 5 n=1 Tax=Vespa crabro TaxID=7445 RepID=UPI001F00775B|nr:baculoviral IAP repeat-containing protein 5 [Vespa crabro]